MSDFSRTPFALREPLDPRQKGDRRHRRRAKLLELEQMPIAGHDCVGARRPSQGDEVVVSRIARDHAFDGLWIIHGHRAVAEPREEPVDRFGIRARWDLRARETRWSSSASFGETMRSNAPSRQRSNRRCGVPPAIRTAETNTLTSTTTRSTYEARFRRTLRASCCTSTASASAWSSSIVATAGSARAR